ncbi:lysine-specific demethylase 7B-like [Sycon ciliatum]|uniref:lysine-specific demethylase 7B-like n=1 Tax=Sycon ciliatum TaxID=27933 RepID=UPI0020A85B82|eukprot:scpid33140/ scgid14855/ Histone lysine demethylase PHF8; PHD finger protein 8
MATSGADLYCICRTPYSDGVFMIQCDRCEDWFHGSCVGVSEAQSSYIDQYHCPGCTAAHGPMKIKPRRNVQRHNYQDLEAGRVAQSDTDRLVFIRQLQARSFPHGDGIVEKLSGEQMNKDYMERHGFAWPMKVSDKKGLGIQVPPPDFTITDVEQCVGPLRELNAIDVAIQEDFKMCMHEWSEYFSQPVTKRRRTLNVISLEFSDSKLSDLVQSPSVVRQVDWLDLHWPRDAAALSLLPKIQKYVLMGTEGSYTDFHIDFGGSSVWYHVLWGEKIFYMIRPTKENLDLFEKWSSSPKQNEVFFGDQVDKCYRCRVLPGETFFIPTGWIHAVLTPADSLVFGGNFLHRYNMPLQLWVYGMETRIKMQARLLLPAFETLHWYAAVHLLADLKRRVKSNRGSTVVVPAHLHQGAEALHKALKTWTSDEGIRYHESFIPSTVDDVQRLIHSFGKILKSCKADEPPPPPLVVQSATNPLKLKINSKALTMVEERKKKTKAELSNSNIQSSASTTRNQPIAIAVKSISPISLKVSLGPIPMPASNKHSNSKSSSRSKSRAGWENFPVSGVKSDESSMSAEEESSNSSSTATSTEDESGSSDSDSDSDTAESSHGTTTFSGTFEMASPGLTDPSLPVQPAGEDELEDEDWVENGFQANNHKRKRDRTQGDRTRGVDCSWHPGAPLNATHTKSSKKPSSKVPTPSAKRPCKTPSPDPVTEEPPKQVQGKPVSSKVKKGSATAKQRLGKKLKLCPRSVYGH